MIRTKGRLRFCITLLILNLLFIWGNSLMPGEVSKTISMWIKNLLFSSGSGVMNPELGHGLLRKVAHFMEFGCLGTILCWLVSMLGKKPWHSLIYSILAACVDESIQCFVPERGPGLRDVMIDTAGAALGMLLLLAGDTVYKNSKQKFLKENTK